jgi:hypothetical protein
VPIRRSGLRNTASTVLTFLGLFGAICRKRSLLTAIRAVSDPEKKAEKDKSSTKSKIIRTIPAVLMAHLSKVIVRFVVVFIIKYYPYHRRLFKG